MMIIGSTEYERPVLVDQVALGTRSSYQSGMIENTTGEAFRMLKQLRCKNSSSFSGFHADLIA